MYMYIHVVCFVSFASIARSLREHLLDLLVAQVDLVHRVAALLKWHVFVVAEGWDEDLGVPDESLAGGEVRDLLSHDVSG
jgi:hypothetical protein